MAARNSFSPGLVPAVSSISLADMGPRPMMILAFWTISLILARSSEITPG